MWTRLLSKTLTLALATSTLSTAAMAERSLRSERSVMRAESEVDSASRSLLRHLRSLIREARRATEYEIVGKADRLLDQTRVFYLRQAEGASEDILRSLVDSMFPQMRSLGREVQDVEGVDGGRITDDYRDVKRTLNLLAELVDGNVEPEASILIEAGTWFKYSTGQSSSIPDSLKCFVQAGTRIAIVEDTLEQVGSHVLVELAESLPGCDFGEVGTSGYFYSAHVAW